MVPFPKKSAFTGFRHPAGTLEIDWSNPATRGLRHFILVQDGWPVDLVTGKAPDRKNNGGLRVNEFGPAMYSSGNDEVWEWTTNLNDPNFLSMMTMFGPHDIADQSDNDYLVSLGSTLDSSVICGHRTSGSDDTRVYQRSANNTAVINSLIHWDTYTPSSDNKPKVMLTTCSPRYSTDEGRYFESYVEAGQTLGGNPTSSSIDYYGFDRLMVSGLALGPTSITSECPNDVHCFAFWDRKITPGEGNYLTKNPWSMLKRADEPAFLFTAAATVQTAIPFHPPGPKPQPPKQGQVIDESHPLAKHVVMHYDARLGGNSRPRAGDTGTEKGWGTFVRNRIKMIAGENTQLPDLITKVARNEEMVRNDSGTMLYLEQGWPTEWIQKGDIYQGTVIVRCAMYGQTGGIFSQFDDAQDSHYAWDSTNSYFSMFITTRFNVARSGYYNQYPLTDPHCLIISFKYNDAGAGSKRLIYRVMTAGGDRLVDYDELTVHYSSWPDASADRPFLKLDDLDVAYVTCLDRLLTWSEMESFDADPYQLVKTDSAPRFLFTGEPSPTPGYQRLPYGILVSKVNGVTPAKVNGVM